MIADYTAEIKIAIFQSVWKIVVKLLANRGKLRVFSS